MNAHGIGERPQRSGEYERRCAKTPFPAFRFRTVGTRGNGYGLRRPVRLLVGTSGAGPGPNAVRPYVGRSGEVWLIVWATARFGLRDCDFN